MARWGLWDGTARDVTDPDAGLEATTLIEAMNPRVFSTALKQDVVTIVGPGCCESCLNNGTSMTSTSKFRMGDHIFEKPVPPSGAKQIWRADEHAGCNDPCVRFGYEDGNAVVGKYL
jgi:hypothetical protein